MVVGDYTIGLTKDFVNVEDGQERKATRTADIALNNTLDINHIADIINRKHATVKMYNVSTSALEQEWKMEITV